MNKIGLRVFVHKECNKKLQGKQKYPKHEVDMFLDVILDCIMDALIKTKRVSLRDIGVLEILHSRDRDGWNPHKKEPMTIKGSARIKFTPATKIDKIINPHRFKK